MNDNNDVSKEYDAWNSIFKRCYSKSVKENRPTYINKVVCKDWVLYSKFLSWIQSQENYNKWLNNEGWCIDKDILQKGNVEYCAEKCLLVPEYVNCLFVKCDSHRGKYPVGVYYDKDSGKYKAQCQNPFDKKYKNLGRFNTVEEAFKCYKDYKEKLIKEMAIKEYGVGNITKQCYDAMMKYEVEITD